MKKTLLLGLFLQAILFAVHIFILPFYIDSLGVKAYGLIAFSITLTAIVQMADMGYPVAINREISQKLSGNLSVKEVIGTFETVNTIISLIVCVFIFNLVFFSADILFKGELVEFNNFNGLILIISVHISLVFNNNFYINCLYALEKGREVNVLKIIYTIVNNGFILLLVLKFGFGIEEYFLVNILSSLFLLWFLKKQVLKASLFPTKLFFFEIEIFKKISYFAIPLMGTSILGSIFGQVDKYILIKIFDIQEYGYYMYAVTFGVAIYSISAASMNLFISKYNILYAKNMISEYAELLEKNLLLFSAVSFPGVVAVFLAPETILSLIITNKEMLTNAAIIAPWLIAASFINAMALPFYASHIVSGKVKITLIYFIFQIIILYTICQLLVDNYGFVGAGYALITSAIINIIIYISSTSIFYLAGKNITKIFLSSIKYCMAVLSIFSFICYFGGLENVPSLAIAVICSYALSYFLYSSMQLD